MGTKERRARERNEVREKIMNAARELFVREGVDAVSMRKVADAAEYSPTAIYLHFKDKDALLREICAEDFGTLAETFGAISHDPDPIHRIAEIGKAYARFGLAHPDQYRFMFMTVNPTEELTEEELDRKGDPDEDGYAFLKATVTEAIARKRLRPEFDDADLVAQTLWSALHGVVSLQITKGACPWIEWASFEQRIAAIMDAVMNGMAAERDLAGMKNIAGAKKGRRS